jgi:ATP-binding cassette subfamily B protein
MAFISPSTTLILNLGLTLLVFVGARRVNSGLTQTGTIIAFLSYFTIILDALLGISKIFLIGSKGAASANRIAEVLEAPEDLKVLAVDEPSEEGRQAPVGLRDTPLLTFDHVTFSYNKVESNVEDLSFSLQAGQTLGIIGPTGSGKSTILNLLLRLYDPDKGTIRIKGRDIRTMEPKALHALFGVVFQNDFLMQGTIRENLDYGRGLSDDALWRAAELAQAVRAANLSGGQRQRLFIARAIARKPEILVLDDSSSALDYQTDAALRHALHHQHSRLVQVIVAQRVSAIAGADLILVMDDGKVLAAGTHETLYETCPAYREITDIQMGGLRHA